MVFCIKNFREKASIQQHFDNCFELLRNDEGGYVVSNAQSKKKMSLSILIQANLPQQEVLAFRHHLREPTTHLLMVEAWAFFVNISIILKKESDLKVFT